MAIHRVGIVSCFDIQAGRVEQHDSEFIFYYQPDYLLHVDARPVSLCMPLRTETYTSKTLHPFFDGLIPEGWLLEIGVKNWKLNPRDRMGLLLALCRDCIGAVHILPELKSKKH